MRIIKMQSASGCAFFHCIAAATRLRHQAVPPLQRLAAIYRACAAGHLPQLPAQLRSCAPSGVWCRSLALWAAACTNLRGRTTATSSAVVAVPPRCYPCSRAARGRGSVRLQRLQRLLRAWLLRVELQLVLVMTVIMTSTSCCALQRWTCACAADSACLSAGPATLAPAASAD